MSLWLTDSLNIESKKEVVLLKPGVIVTGVLRSCENLLAEKK